MPPTAVDLADLMPPGFLESVAQLRIVARRVPRGGRFAEQRSASQGAGLEFRDHRAYVPGDDLRSVDWNIYRRLGRVFVRLYEELEDLPVYLIPDISESMFVETPPRGIAGLQCALALAAVSLRQHDRVGVLPFDADLGIHVRPQAGADRIIGIARHLTRLSPGGTTNLARSMHRLNSLKLRQGLAVIISDFFDPAGIESITAALKSVRHRLLLVQLVRTADRTPHLQGDLRLLDCESGQVEEVSVTSNVLRKYHTVYDDFNMALSTFVQQRSSGLIRIDADRDVVPQLATLFEAGSLQV
jgi:uncharacterized protein (DUF58 family)